VSHSLREQSVSQHGASAFVGWRQFRDHPIAIGNEHGLALLGEPHVLAELVLQYFYPYGSHDINVASGSYFCQQVLEPVISVAVGRILDSDNRKSKLLNRN
jgi:hypothetical protein